MKRTNLWKPFIAIILTLITLETTLFAQQQTTSSAPSGPLRDRKALTLEMAKKMVEAAEAKARENGWKVNIAIVDEGGNLQAFHRMDGAFIGSIQIAMGKAHTAIAFQRETKAFQELAQPGGRAFGIQNVPGIVILEGGKPIKVGEDTIGGCGVSGARGDQDAEVCQAALDALAKELGK
jgi:uncharacterized protein GlcG (DUF336 family)